MPIFQTLRQTVDTEEFGPIGTKFRRWLLDLIAVAQPDEIAFEAPWVASGNRKASHPTPTYIPRLLIGLAFLAEQIADEAGIPCTEADVSTVRKLFLGHGRPDNAKAKVIRRCRDLGWRVQDDHQADAAAIWTYTKMDVDRSFVLPPPGVLFANVRVTA